MQKKSAFTKAILQHQHTININSSQNKAFAWKSYTVPSSHYKMVMQKIKRRFIQKEQLFLQHRNYKQWHQFQFRALQSWMKVSKCQQQLLHYAKQFGIDVPQYFFRSLLIDDRQPTQKIKQFQSCHIPKNRLSNHTRNKKREAIRSKTFLSPNRTYNRFIKINSQKYGLKQAKKRWSLIQGYATKFVKDSLQRIKFNGTHLHSICPKCQVVISNKSMRSHLVTTHSFQLKQQIIKAKFDLKLQGNTALSYFHKIQVETIDCSSGVCPSWQKKSQFIPIVLQQNQKVHGFALPQTYPQQFVHRFTLTQVQNLLKQCKYVSLTQLSISNELNSSMLKKLSTKAEDQNQQFNKLRMVMQCSQSIYTVQGAVKVIPNSIKRGLIAQLIDKTLYQTQFPQFNLFDPSQFILPYTDQQFAQIGFDKQFPKQDTLTYLSDQITEVMKQPCLIKRQFTSQIQKKTEKNLDIMKKSAFYHKYAQNHQLKSLQRNLTWLVHNRQTLFQNNLKNLKEYNTKVACFDQKAISAFLIQQLPKQHVISQWEIEFMAKYPLTPEISKKYDNVYQKAYCIHVIDSILQRIQNARFKFCQSMACVQYFKMVLKSKGQLFISNQNECTHQPKLYQVDSQLYQTAQLFRWTHAHETRWDISQKPIFCKRSIVERFKVIKAQIMDQEYLGQEQLYNQRMSLEI